MKKNNYQFPFTSFVRNPAFYNTQLKIEEKYRSIVENSVQAFFLTEADETILESNHAASIMFGYSSEELKKLKRWQIICQTDLALLPALQPENNCFSLTEATGIKKNGEEFPIEISSSIFIDAQGQYKSSIMISDISLRKKTEAAMQLSNERYDLVVKATKDLVWDWDLITGDIYRNGSNLMDVYGHSSNDSIGNIHDWSDFIHPHDKEKVMADIDHFTHSATETAFNFEYRFKKEDGTYAYINDKGYILRNETGKAIRMIGAAEDITERKNIALAIEESEQRYKMFVQQSTEGIWRIEFAEPMHIGTPIDEMILYCFDNSYLAECNDAFAQLYGYHTAEKIIGCPLNRLMPADNEVNIAFLLKFFSNKFVIKDEVSHEVDKDDNPVIFLNNMVGIIEGDYIQRVWGTQRNITEQVALQNTLNEEREIRQQQITEAVIAGQEKERTELGEELHDNINQILASTKLYIECAMKDENPRMDLIAESKLLIEKAMFEIRNLSKSLLPPSLGKTGLLQALHELVENINEVNELSIHVDWKIMDENNISNKLKLTIFRIIQEQLNNVIKHANAQQVIISITETGKHIKLGIQDNGIGFNTELKRKGVGLRNISSRAQVNKGVVSIDSEPGAGCEVIVTFPVEPTS